MSLSPWDVGSVLSFEFSVYQPRRNSYMLATRGRRRPSSYKRAVRRSSHDKGDAAENGEIEAESSGNNLSGLDDEFSASGTSTSGTVESDYINNVLRNRYRNTWRMDANGQRDPLDLAAAVAATTSALQMVGSIVGNANKYPKKKPQGHTITIAVNDEPIDRIKTKCRSSNCENNALDEQGLCRVCRNSARRYKTTLLILCLGFILVFTAFRSIQNLQSTMFGSTGAWAMFTVYMVMFGSCLFVPYFVARLGAKLSMLIGLFCYLIWFFANLYPSMATLLPTSGLVGFGQSMAWNAQVIYLSTLSREYYDMNREAGADIYRFNALFLAGFQTSHLWGNLISSLILGGNLPPRQLNTLLLTSSSKPMIGNASTLLSKNHQFNSVVNMQTCGKFDCYGNSFDGYIVTGYSSLIWLHIGLAILGFTFVLCLLRKIDVKGEDERTLRQVADDSWQQMTRDRTFRLLIPLLMFNGFEQGFVYADYNKSFISCPLGLGYIGWSMMVLGLANAMFSIAIGALTKQLPREVIMGLAAMMHVTLLLFLLVWEPQSRHLPILLGISALWGICDSVWQTQCNVLIGIGCTADSETAFVNFRLLQALGAAMAFGLSAFMCIKVKLFILLLLLIFAIIGYVVAEYDLRHRLNEQNALENEVVDAWASEATEQLQHLKELATAAQVGQEQQRQLHHQQLLQMRLMEKRQLQQGLLFEGIPSPPTTHLLPSLSVPQSPQQQTLLSLSEASSSSMTTTMLLPKPIKPKQRLMEPRQQSLSFAPVECLLYTATHVAPQSTSLLVPSISPTKQISSQPASSLSLAQPTFLLPSVSPTQKTSLSPPTHSPLSSQPAFSPSQAQSTSLLVPSISPTNQTSLSPPSQAKSKLTQSETKVFDENVKLCCADSNVKVETNNSVDVAAPTVTFTKVVGQRNNGGAIIIEETTPMKKF